MAFSSQNNKIIAALTNFTEFLQTYGPKHRRHTLVNRVIKEGSMIGGQSKYQWAGDIGTEVHVQTGTSGLLGEYPNNNIGEATYILDQARQSRQTVYNMFMEQAFSTAGGYGQFIGILKSLPKQATDLYHDRLVLTTLSSFVPVKTVTIKIAQYAPLAKTNYKQYLELIGMETARTYENEFDKLKDNRFDYTTTGVMRTSYEKEELPLVMKSTFANMIPTMFTPGLYAKDGILAPLSFMEKLTENYFLKDIKTGVPPTDGTAVFLGVGPTKNEINDDNTPDSVRPAAGVKRLVLGDEITKPLPAVTYGIKDDLYIGYMFDPDAAIFKYGVTIGYTFEDGSMQRSTIWEIIAYNLGDYLKSAPFVKFVLDAAIQTPSA